MKIRRVPLAEAQQLQDSGPAGWVSSMAEDLGARKIILDFQPGRCRLTGGLWWMLGLLDASIDASDASANGIQIGATVRVRDGITPRHGWGEARGERGRVTEIQDDGDVIVHFPSHPGWLGVLSDLTLCDADDRPSLSRGPIRPIRVGSLVRVRREISQPSYSWGSVSHGDRGRVVSVEADDVHIDFPSQNGWHGIMSELELCDEDSDSEPAVRDDVEAEPEPYGGHEEDWADEEAAVAFHCPICLKVCREAVMHSCRTIFCESCWNHCHASDSKCPVCRNSERPAAQAYQQQWDVGKLMIKCPNACGETFSLNEKQQLLPKHLTECSCRKERCQHCGLEVLAADFSQHLEECDAQVECDRCGLIVAASSLEEHRTSPSKEHMAALIRENGALKQEVQGLQEEVGNLKDAFKALGFSTD